MEIMSYVFPIAMVIVGFIVCFNGYKLFRVSITCLGAFIGYEIGNFLVGNFSKMLAIESNQTVQYAIIAVFTIVLGASAFVFYKKAIIYITTLAVTLTIIKYCGNASWKLILISLLIGIAVGFVIFIIQKWAIMLATAFGGSYIIGTTIMVLVTYLKPVENALNNAGTIVAGEMSVSLYQFISAVLIVFFLVAGFIAQLQGDD